MKKLILMFSMLLALVGAAFGQSNRLPIDAGSLRGGVSAQSTSFTMTEKGLNFLWLNDGYDNLAAISYTIAPISGTNGRLRLQALGAADTANANQRTYLSMGLGYNLFNAASGFRLDLFAGPKGWNINDGWKFQEGRGSFVFGFGLSIPIGK